MRASLILANGQVFTGEGAGAPAERVCELVFNTSMTGYQEILTDPSYAGQGVVMTYPLMGNYGVNQWDGESDRPWVRALVVRQLAGRGSNFRCEESLGDYLARWEIPAITGVDTRCLTRVLRNQGTMNAMITFDPSPDLPACLERLAAYRVDRAVEQVTREAPQTFPAQGEEHFHVALLDFGVKRSIVTSLCRRGCRVTALPAHTDARDILAGGYDGVVLSNGPGDPADNREIIEQVRALYHSDLPVFGICLGHQLLALAAGASTRKMRFGHRGANHPVKDIARGRVYITNQNHGYTVAEDSVDPAVARVSHVNVNEGSIEGLVYTRPRCFTVQFHPEAAPGPLDCGYLFDEFISTLKEGGVHHA